MAYETKKEGSIIQVLRNGKHIASYDPVAEETTYRSPEFEKYSNHVGRTINDLLEAPPAPPTEPTPTPPAADTTPKGEPLKLLTDEEAAELEKQKVNPPFAEATGEVKIIASALYTAYCGAVGGKAFNGDPLPDAEEFFADTGKTLQSNAWLTAAAEAIELLSKAGSSSLKSQLLTAQAENARLRDEVTKLASGKTLSPTPERFADPIDTTGAPVQDKQLGDLTPAYVEWAREIMEPEIFERRYKNRLGK